MDFETLRKRLLEHVNDRVRNGELTERGLARMIGISQPHMHHILKGVRGLSVETADRILRHLDLSVVDLMGAFPPHPAPPQRVIGRVEDELGVGELLETHGW